MEHSAFPIRRRAGLMHLRRSAPTRTGTRLAALVAAALLSACASPPESVVTGPLSAAPVPRPLDIERVNTGAIFRPDMSTVSLFSGDRKPRRVGDTLKVNIAENLNATSSVNTNTSRDTSLASKGPGSQSGLGLITSVMNLNGSASGSDAFKGTGTTGNTSQFTGQLAVTVINVLPNGNLVVAGDRKMAMNGGVSVLRFSGIVNPKDIQAGNVVASADTVNARLEVAGRGEVSDAASRSWMQRVLTDSLAIW